MSVSVSERTPLIYATSSALEAGRRLLPGRCLELEVERSIQQGRIVRRDGRLVVSTDDVECVVRRERRRSNRELWQWTVVSVAARSGRR